MGAECFVLRPTLLLLLQFQRCILLYIYVYMVVLSRWKIAGGWNGLKQGLSLPLSLGKKQKHL